MENDLTQFCYLFTYQQCDQIKQFESYRTFRQVSCINFGVNAEKHLILSRQQGFTLEAVFYEKTLILWHLKLHENCRIWSHCQSLLFYYDAAGTGAAEAAKQSASFFFLTTSAR